MGDMRNTIIQNFNQKTFKILLKPAVRFSITLLSEKHIFPKNITPKQYGVE